MSQIDKLIIKNLTVNFHGYIPFNSISFSAKEGEVIFLKGNNGSGKTTLLKALSGLIYIKNGSIQYNHSLKHLLLFPEREIYNNLTGKENIDYFLSYFKNLNWQKSNRFKRWINEVSPFKMALNKKANELSKGMATLISLFISLESGIKLLLWDEPFSSLDKTIRQFLFEEINKDKKHIIIFTGHEIENPFSFQEIKLLR